MVCFAAEFETAVAGPVSAVLLTMEFEFALAPSAFTLPLAELPPCSVDAFTALFASADVPPIAPAFETAATGPDLATLLVLD
jgi:hypothetical protein